MYFGFRLHGVRYSYNIVATRCQQFLHQQHDVGIVIDYQDPRHVPACTNFTYLSVRLSARKNGCPEPLGGRSEEHTSELQSQSNLVCRLLLEKKKNTVFHYRRSSNHPYTESCRSTSTCS